MPRRCVDGCNAAWKNSDVKFHKFPRDEQLCSKWLECVGLPPSKLTPWTTVCSQHFCDADYDRDLRAELTGNIS